jgi:hypothetical protein
VNAVRSEPDRAQPQRAGEQQRGYRRGRPEPVGGSASYPAADRRRPGEREQPREPEGRADEYAGREREDGAAGRGDRDQRRDRPGQHAPQRGRRPASRVVGRDAIAVAYRSCDRPGQRYGERREDGEQEDQIEPGPFGQPGRGRDEDELRRGNRQAERAEGPAAAAGLHEGGDRGRSAHRDDAEPESAQGGERDDRPEPVGCEVTQRGQSEQPGAEHERPAPPQAGQQAAHRQLSQDGAGHHDAGDQPGPQIVAAAADHPQRRDGHEQREPGEPQHRGTEQPAHAGHPPDGTGRWPPVNAHPASVPRGGSGV